MRSFWLCKKVSRKKALRFQAKRQKERGKTPEVEFEIFEPKSDQKVPNGTVTRAKASCPVCNMVLGPDRVRAQLAAQRGGADVVFNAKSRRIGGAQLLAVVLLKPDDPGRHYRLPTDRDYEAVRKAQERVALILGEWERGTQHGLCPIPDEPLPLMSGTFNVPLYGMNRWGDLFTARQKATLVTLARAIESRRHSDVSEVLGLVLDRNAVLATWRPQADQEKAEHVFARQALPMSWDFAEAVPLSASTGSWDDRVNDTSNTIEVFSRWTQSVNEAGQVQGTDATEYPLPDETAQVWFTNPPYYFAVPYADLSDFFFVWLKRALPDHSLLQDRFDPENVLTPKRRELCEMAHWDPDRYAYKDQTFFENGMQKAFAEGRRVLHDSGVGSVVFAHKTTEGWEALLSGMIRGGWTITGSWPIATEMGSRLRARGPKQL